MERNLGLLQPQLGSSWELHFDVEARLDQAIEQDALVTRLPGERPEWLPYFHRLGESKPLIPVSAADEAQRLSPSAADRDQRNRIGQRKNFPFSEEACSKSKRVDGLLT